MTAEEAIKVLRDIKLGIFIDTYFDEPEKSVSKENEALEIAIEALEPQPCEDCVSRKLLSDNICEGISCNECSFNEIDGECGCLLQKRFDELPSVQPTRPTGKWIKMPLIEAGQTYSHECSLCGRRILITDVGLSEFPYCHCGARMGESEEEE